MSIFKVDSFSGGKTDFPVDANPSQFEEADNSVINQYGDLEHRPGLIHDFTTTGIRARLPTSLRVGLMAPQKTGTSKAFTVLKQSSTKLFYDNGTTRTELVGPASASAFNITDMDDEVAFAYSEWNEHTIITHEEPYQRPVKVYRESSGTLTLRTAGLPPVAGSGIAASGGSGAAYVYAFVYKYTYNVGSTEYIDRSRPYLKSFASLASDPSSVTIALSSIPVLANASGEHYDTATIKVEIYRTTAGGIVPYYVGEVTNGTTTFNDTVANATLETANVTLYTTGGVLENDLPPKAKYVHGTSDYTFYGHGYEVSTTGADGELLPQRLWQSKRGDPDSVPAGSFADIEEPITGVSSIKSVPIVFGDNSVYRIDGAYDNLGRGGMTPRKISDQVGCVGHLSIVQTLDGLYFAGNDGFYYTDGYKIYSLSAEDFKNSYARLVETDLQKKRIYGTYDALNKRILWAAHDPERDTEEENNLIYCMYLPAKKFTTWSSGYDGDGPYLEGSATVVGTAATIGSTLSLIRGDFVRVIGVRTWDMYVATIVGGSTTEFTLSSSLTNGTYDLQFFRNESRQIDVYGNFQPSSLLYANDTVWQGDGRGFTFKYDRDTLSDVQVDERVDATSASAITPQERTILFNYSGPILSLGTTAYRKWVNSVLVKARPRVDVSCNVALQVFGENDDSDYLQETREIFSQAFYPWGTPLLSYGDPRLYRRRQKIVDEMRRFPKNGLRCEYKQVHIKSAFVDLFNSDAYGTCDPEDNGNGTSTVTFSGTLPTTSLYGCWFTSEIDGYVAEWKIIAQTTTTVTLVSGPTAPTGSAGTKWVIRGYPLDNFINLIEYSFSYEVLGDSQGSYSTRVGSVAAT
jgi:hypothetical protein